MIVTVTRTVMDGTVVRWYLTTRAEENNAPIITASRNGVRVNAWLADVPDERLGAARRVWDLLRHDNRADVDSFATHARKGLNGPLEPIQRQPGEVAT